MKNIIIAITILAGILGADTNTSKNQKSSIKAEVQKSAQSKETSVKPVKKKVYPRGTIATH